MRSTEPLNQHRAVARAGKFQTIKDCETRLATLLSEKYKPYQIGIGARDHEIAALREKLHELQNPTML